MAPRKSTSRKFEFKNPVKAQLKQGKSVFGPVISVNNVEVAAQCAALGFDFIWLEMEHAPLSLETVRNAVLAPLRGLGLVVVDEEHEGSYKSEEHPRFHAILEAFERRTGCAVLVNTSFNVRGEPIVCTPLDAYRCFRRTDMDALVLGQFLLERGAQPEFAESEDWKKEFVLD